jgi:hypothetical protein
MEKQYVFCEVGAEFLNVKFTRKVVNAAKV